MSIPVTCYLCGHTFRVKEKYAGRTGRCPRCNTTLVVPETNQPHDIPSDDATRASVRLAATSSILSESAGPTVEGSQIAKYVGYPLVALLSLGVLVIGVISKDFSLALQWFIQLGCLSALASVVWHMFQNERFVIGGLTLFAWILGVPVLLASSFSLFGSGPPESEWLAIASLAGMMLLVLGLFLPYIVGWIYAESWNIRRLMWCWSILILANFLVIIANAGRQAAEQPSLARQNSVATPSNQIRNPIRTVSSESSDQALPDQSPKTVSSRDEQRIPQDSTDDSSTNDSTTSPAETELHVKLGNGVYVKNQDRFGLSDQYDVSVDFTFDPQRTEPAARYFWVIDSPTGRAEMWLTDRGQGTLQGSLRRFSIHRHLQREEKDDDTWQCWVEIDTPGSPFFRHSRPRVSEVVTMHPADRMPPPKEYEPLPRREQIAEIPRRNPPQTSPPAQSQRKPPRPQPEVTLDETLDMVQENDKQRVKFALRWLCNNAVDEAQHGEVAKRVAPLLKHPDGFVRKDAAKVMGLYATEKYIPELIEALEDKSFVVRNEARDALASFHDARAAEAIVGLIEDDRIGAVRALKRMGPVAEPAVIGLLEHPDQFVRGDAAEILGEIGSHDSMKALKNMSNDPSFHARLAAEQAHDKIEFRLKQQQRTRPSATLKSV